MSYDGAMQSGDRLGEYVLQELIGEGGFGEVWKAQTLDYPGPVVAIKIPTKPDCAAALRREGALQNVVDHPNVVRTLSVNTSNDPPYLVSEYVAGESLRRRLDRVKRMTPRDALEVLVQVLAALGAAHRAGVVHRDVKPENVLLGPDGVAKLSDFGLGRITESVASSMALSRGRSLTEGGGIVGTYHYMSPEQMKGQPVDLRSDLYSCGVMLYEMLTGEAHPIRIPVDGVSRAISGIVDQALRTDLLKRFQSATQMASALEAAVSSTGVHDPLAPGGVPAQPVGPFPRRPRTLSLPKAAPSCALLIGIVAAAVIGMGVFMTTRRSQAMRQEAEARVRAMDEEQIRVTQEVGGTSNLDRPLIDPFPGGGSQSAWLAALHQAEQELENGELERANADLRRLIGNAGVADDEVTKLNLQEAYYCAARAQAKLSNPDTAFADLQRAIDLGFRDQLRMQTEADLTSLKKDPRWKKMLDRLKR